MDGDGNVRPRGMKQPCVAAALVVNVVSGPFQSGHDLFRLERRQSRRRHFPAGLGNRDLDVFRRYFGNVVGNRLARFERALKIAADRVAGHFARLRKRLAKSANFTYGWHRTLYPPSGIGSKIVV